MQEAREELFGILESDEMRGVPVVVLANKTDLPSKYTIDSLMLLYADFNIGLPLQSFCKHYLLYLKTPKKLKRTWQQGKQ